MRKRHLFVLLTITNILGLDNLHFYRASNFWPEPRLEREKLGTFNVYLSGGETDKSYATDHHSTELLNIYNPLNLHYLGKNLPSLDLSNELDKILDDLQKLPKSKNFGEFKYSGKFQTIEANINLFQNFYHGLFAQLHFPIRKLELTQINYVDLSSSSDLVYPNKNTPEWTNFLSHFSQILERYEYSYDPNTYIQPFNQIGIGDLSLLIGWTKNHQKLEFLDFIDFTIRGGLLFPTGKQSDENKIFCLPTGYNGHWGIPLKCNTSLGLYDWLTIGLEIGGLFLIGRTKNLRLETSSDQNGFIKLTKENKKATPGQLWNFNFFFKVDHLFQKLSFLLGYTYDRQQRTCVENYLISTDKIFRGWKMHSINLAVELDCAKETAQKGLHISLFYNQPLKGTRIFKTEMFGGNFGLDIVWQ